RPGGPFGRPQLPDFPQRPLTPAAPADSQAAPSSGAAAGAGPPGGRPFREGTQMPATATKRKSDAFSLPIGDRTLAGLTQVFKLLADESRLRILLTLSREGEMHVSALCQMLGQSQPAVSHHLTLLRMAGL